MELILKEDIPSLGRAGDVVRVTEGYGRNYLLPRKKAVLATDGNRKILEQGLKALEAKRAAHKKEMEELAARLSQLTIVLEREAGDEEKIFGTVTSRQIAEALGTLGYSIDHRVIHLAEPIRHLGEFQVTLALHEEVKPSLKLQVKRK